MKSTRKKIPQKAYILPVLLMALVTFLVIFSTSYYGHDNDNGHSQEPNEEQPVSTPAPVIVQPPTTINEPPEEIEEEPEPPLEDTIISINETDPYLTALMNYFSIKYEAVSVSLVLYDYELRDYYTYIYGYRDFRTLRPTDIETKFCVASLSKLVTVICAMTLVDDGKLDLDKDISDYLGYEVRNPLHPEKAITVRMLMQHTSSLYDSERYLRTEGKYLPETTQQLLESNRNYNPHEPGTHFEYSPFLAYSVIGLICEKISEKRFDEFANEVLFSPLEIEAAFLPANLSTRNIALIYSYYENYWLNLPTLREQLRADNPETRESEHDRVGANLTISALDYSKILIMLGNGGIYNDVMVLSEEAVKEIHKANIEAPDFMQGLATRYQNNDSTPFAKSYWHPGSAWGVNSQYIHYFDETTNRGIVVLTSGTPAEWINGMHAMSTELSLIASRIFTDGFIIPAYTPDS